MYTLGEERADFCGVLQSRLQLMLINLLKCDSGYSYTRCYSSTYTKGIFWCLHYHRTYGYWSSPNYSFESKFIGGALSGITLPPTIKDTNTSQSHLWSRTNTVFLNWNIFSTFCISSFEAWNTFIRQMSFIEISSPVTCCWMQIVIWRYVILVSPGLMQRMSSWQSMLSQDGTGHLSYCSTLQIILLL